MRRGLAILIFALLVPFTGQAQLPRPTAPSLVLHNAKVITVDAAFSLAEAVAIDGDRVMAVGTSPQMRAIAGPSTGLIDLKGQALLPGLMDNHLHGAGGGHGVDLSRARSLADVAAAISARAQTATPGDVTVREPYGEPWGEGRTFRGLQTIDTERFVATVWAFNGDFSAQSFLPGWTEPGEVLGSDALGHACAMPM